MPRACTPSIAAKRALKHADRQQFLPNFTVEGIDTRLRKGEEHKLHVQEVAAGADGERAV